MHKSFFSIGLFLCVHSLTSVGAGAQSTADDTVAVIAAIVSGASASGKRLAVVSEFVQPGGRQNSNAEPVAMQGGEPKFRKAVGTKADLVPAIVNEPNPRVRSERWKTLRIYSEILTFSPIEFHADSARAEVFSATVLTGVGGTYLGGSDNEYDLRRTPTGWIVTRKTTVRTSMGLLDS